MGLIRIETSGSFPASGMGFTANERGHAHAVAEAIQWLSEEVLPAAIEQDHRLHDEGLKPLYGFNRMSADEDPSIAVRE